MGKKTKLPFLHKPTAAPSWPWPTCASHPRTLSFRATDIPNDNIQYAQNSGHFDHSKESFHFSGTDTEEYAVVGGLRSDRLFFDPGETNSILGEVAKTHDFPYKDNSVSILAMDSRDPFLDFRSSMEEMVAAYGLNDWECLEELLTCYLRINPKCNHGYVVGAFVDMLLNPPFVSADTADSSAAGIDDRCSSSSDTTPRCFTSPVSSFSTSSTSLSGSPCLSSLGHGYVLNVRKNGGCSPPPPSYTSSG